MKIKCKLEDPMVERMEAVKAAVPDMPVTVDPNTRFYTRAAAAELARRLGAVGNVAVFEDPIPKEDFDEYARLRQEMQGTGIPLALHLGRADDLRRAINGGCIDVVNASPLSMVTFVEMAAMAEAAGIPCWHGSGNDCGPMTWPTSTPAPRRTAPCPATSWATGCTWSTSSPRPSPSTGAGPCSRRGRAWGQLDLAAVERQLSGAGKCPSKGRHPRPRLRRQEGEGDHGGDGQGAAVSRAVCPPAPAAITPSRAGPMM